MTYKSFATLNELFDLLVKRFRIQPPDNLNPRELEEWRKLKQHVIQMRLVTFQRGCDTVIKYFALQCHQHV
jgi:son of sevenless